LQKSAIMVARARPAGRICNVSDSTESGGAAMSPAGAPPERRARVLVILASLLLLIGSTVIGYLLGRDIASRPLAEALLLVHQLQPEAQQLKGKIAEQGSTIITLQTKLKRAEAALHAITPAKDTYNINANESLVVGNGNLTIGMIGAPTNNGVTLNINGVKHTAATGDIFDVTPDPSTKCHVRVQTFDMFQATVNASCTKAAAK
jgi:hypothetical protein